MATFILHSDIIMGVPGTNQMRFNGVHEIRIKRSLHSYVDTATITLPSIAKIKYKTGSSTPGTVTTGSVWNDGDPVQIFLGYSDGSMQEEFRGFVKRRDLSMPLTIECEGYSYPLRFNEVSGSWKSISVKDLLAMAVQNLPNLNGLTPAINTLCTVDLNLINVRFSKFSGIDIIEYILNATRHAINIFFINPNTLWAGLIYTPYSTGNDVLGLSSVSYKLGYNVVKDNNLKERVLSDNPVSVELIKKTSKGQKLYAPSEALVKELRKRKHFCNQVASLPELKMLANELSRKENYVGYEGKINAFLQPYALPGYKATIIDTRYPERDGIYLLESTEVTFGTGGARRMAEIGPKIGFVNTLTAA